MKTKFVPSVIVSTLLFSSLVFANSYTDSLSAKETNALNHPNNVKKHAISKAETEEANSREAFLAKVKKGAFKQEASQDEQKRLNRLISEEISKHKKLLQKAPKEFIAGLNDTLMAIRSIHSNKIEDAKKLLEKAKKEIAKSFKQNPNLGMIPLKDDTKVISFNGDVKLIKHIEKLAIKLIKNDDVQLAIDILQPLQDEVVTRTRFVSAYIYPKAIKQALKELNTNKKSQAFQTLVLALNSTQVDTLIIPIPLITAQDMILEASRVEKSHKTKALKLLSNAQNELEKAMLLGYVSKDSSQYKHLNQSIEKIKQEIKGKNMVEKLYDEAISSFKKLRK